MVAFPHFDPCVLLNERADLFLAFSRKEGAEMLHSSSAGLWRSFLSDRGEKAGGAVIPLNDIWAFANCTLPSLSPRAGREG